MKADYPEFLAARLDEQEKQIDLDSARVGLTSVPDREYRVAEIASKRAILARYQALHQRIRGEADDFVLNESAGIYAAIRLLCRPFTEHPAYPGE